MNGPQCIERFLTFLKEAIPSPFHAVEASARRLEAAGFTKLREVDAWNLEIGGKYFFTRNASTLVAFTVGGKYVPGGGFNIGACHTDSPVLKVGVECYGGGLWHTWFDRDLSLAGRVIVRDGDSFQPRLLNIGKPILRVPSLCIHLDREVRTKGFQFNYEKQLIPILATEVKGQLEAQEGNHHPLLLEVIADSLGCKVDDIASFDLSLYDTQPPCIGGPKDEFVLSGRLDNLGHCFTALDGLLAAQGNDQESNVRMILLFDHEEVGSSSAEGAGSTTLLDTMRRVNEVLTHGSTEHSLFERAIRKSFLVSADMAHAVHPNYADKHEENHKVQMHKGPVIKSNANQRYMTNGATGFIIRELARRNNIPMQDFVVRNDSACGSTIGPILASGCGIRTMDVGNPQLSMHSIREMGSTTDTVYGCELFKVFFEQFTELDTKLVVDK